MFDVIDKADLPETTEFAILGIPLDATSTSQRAGAKDGPRAIRKGLNYFSLLTELGIDIFQREIYDIGDIEVYPTLIEETIGSIEEVITSLISLNQNHPVIPISLGGDHFITYPIIRGISKNNSKKFGIVVFDAHVDLYDKWLYKEQFAHCTVFHRILDLEQFHKNDLIFIGTRDIDYEEAEFLQSNSIKPLYSYQITDKHLESLLLEQFKIFQDQQIEQIYVSIDIDVLDHSVAPGTGYPIPGGLTYRQLWNALRIAASNFKVIGFDLVEVCPPYDLSEITAITAARILMEFLGFIIKNYETE